MIFQKTKAGHTIRHVLTGSGKFTRTMYQAQDSNGKPVGKLCTSPESVQLNEDKGGKIY